jgi:ABC-type xylose transport system permease subunit
LILDIDVKNKFSYILKQKTTTNVMSNIILLVIILFYMSLSSTSILSEENLANLYFKNMFDIKKFKLILFYILILKIK